VVKALLVCFTAAISLHGNAEQTPPEHDRATARWRRGVVVSGVRRMNEVNARRARLVLGWVTVFGLVYHPGM